MKTWQFALVAWALLATAGCRSDPAIPILERELRCKEDEIYRLRATIEELQDNMNSCANRSGHTARPAGEGDREDAGPRHENDSGESGDGMAPKIEMPSQPSKTPPSTLTPRSGSGPSGIPEAPPEVQGPSKRLGMGGDGPSLDLPTAGTAARKISEPVAFAPSGDSRRVASIALNSIMSGGINSGDASGDQGLLVVVEPRDRAGRSVDAPAQMSVVVLDPAAMDAKGKAARVARWDFTAEETAAMFRRSDSNDAVHLAMAWPTQGPKHNRLHVFVRYVTADGRKLEADGPIEVTLAGEKTAGARQAKPAPSAGWTSAPTSLAGERATGSVSVAGAGATGSASAGVQSADSWRPNPTPSAHDDEPARIATRPDPQHPERPAWSPDRR